MKMYEENQNTLTEKSISAHVSKNQTRRSEKAEKRIACLSEKDEDRRLARVEDSGLCYVSKKPTHDQQMALVRLRGHIFVPVLQQYIKAKNLIEDLHRTMQI